MDPVAATSAARTVDPAAAAGGVAAKGTTFTKALQAATEGDGTRGITRRVKDAEAHAAVDGHRYSRITAGLREGSYLNTSGNARHGQAFTLVERAGRTFHVYGDGPDRRVVEVKARAATPAAPAATTPAATTPAATTPATTTPAATPEPDPLEGEPTDGAGGVEAPADGS